MGSDHLFSVSKETLEVSCKYTLENGVVEKDYDPVSACIQGVIRQLGSTSSYFSPKYYKSFINPVNGGYVGIGLELTSKARGFPLIIKEPMLEGPAERAGILPGDGVLEIDGVSIIPLSMGETIGVMRGDLGKVMTLKIQRQGHESPLSISVQREEVSMVPLRTKRLPGGILYVRISHLNKNVTTPLIKRLQAAVLNSEGKLPQGLILDLRNNPGGHLESLTSIASLLAPPDRPIVSNTGRHTTEVLKTSLLVQGASGLPVSEASNVWRESVPIIVFINERTAGGAEALAQFLKEARAAKLWGWRTSGSVYIRKHVLLGSDAAVQLVTARMVSPMGMNWENGITPDLLFTDEPTVEEFGGDSDHWVQQAAQILRH
jgi:carboxyl-terminal processing protease